MLSKKRDKHAIMFSQKREYHSGKDESRTSKRSIITAIYRSVCVSCLLLRQKGSSSWRSGKNLQKICKKYYSWYTFHEVSLFMYGLVIHLFRKISPVRGIFLFANEWKSSREFSRRRRLVSFSYMKMVKDTPLHSPKKAESSSSIGISYRRSKAVWILPLWRTEDFFIAKIKKVS